MPAYVRLLVSWDSGRTLPDGEWFGFVPVEDAPTGTLELFIDANTWHDLHFYGREPAFLDGLLAEAMARAGALWEDEQGETHLDIDGRRYSGEAWEDYMETVVDRCADDPSYLDSIVERWGSADGGARVAVVS